VASSHNRPRGPSYDRAIHGIPVTSGAVVEPGFVILRERAMSRRSSPAKCESCWPPKGPKTKLSVQHGSRGENRKDGAAGYEIYSVARPLIESTTWLPRPKRSIELLNLLAESSTARVGELFDVKQGTLTG